MSEIFQKQNIEQPIEQDGRRWQNLDWSVLGAKVEAIMSSMPRGANMTLTTQFQENGLFTLTVSAKGGILEQDGIPESVKKRIPDEF